MEAKNKMDGTISTVHYGGSWPDNKYTTKDAPGPVPNAPITEYTTYAVEWWHEKFRFWRNNTMVMEVGANEVF